LEIWWYYKQKKYDHSLVYNRYLLFFSNSEYAHWATTIISIWCLIDEKNISLLSLYYELKKDNKLSNKIITEIDKRLDGIKNIIDGIVKIRHSVVAHIIKNGMQKRPSVKLNY
jgi:hypothetical protein